MERSLDLSEVKKGQAMEKFENKFPRIAAIVKSCLSVKPSLRLSVEELYEDVSDLLVKLNGEPQIIGNDFHRDRWSLFLEVKRLRRLVAKPSNNSMARRSTKLVKQTFDL